MTTMAPISLALVKIKGDAKANDDADTNAITPKKPLNVRFDRNIEPPSFSANLNSSFPLSTNHRTLLKTPTIFFFSQKNWRTQNFPILINNPKSLAYIRIVVVGACLRSIRTLVIYVKTFFLFLLENVIAKKNPLKLGASSEAKKEIQAWWTL